MSASIIQRARVAAFSAVTMASAVCGLLGSADARAVTTGPITPAQPPVGTPIAVCGQNSLDFYVANYSSTSGCSIGIATFYGFAVTNNLNPSAVLVTPTSLLPNIGNFPVVPGFRFSANSAANGPFLNLTNAAATYAFEYYIDPPIDILGLSLEDDPFPGGSSVTETACLGQVGVANCANPIRPLTINQTNQTARTAPFSTRFVDVVTTFDLPAGSSIPSFTERVTVAAVPEPQEVALLGVGGLMLLATRRRVQTHG